MAIPQPSLLKIQSLQPSLQPLATHFIELASQAGIPVQIVQGYRTPEQQAALPSSVTNAPAGLSYHNYGLAFDAVPTEYISLPDWNPTGELWGKLASIGEGLGLEWGGRWSRPDRPHFQIPSSLAPIKELKKYWDDFQQIMPITITPSTGGFAMIALVVIGFFLFQRFVKNVV